MTYTDNLESPPIWRKWCAICTISSILERKVWVETSSNLYPNLYAILVGDAGLGKTRPIMKAKELIREVPEHIPFAPTSVTMASLTDAMVEAQRKLVRLPHSMVEYNALCIMTDELSAFMHEYAGDIIAGLTTFYDGVPYSQTRRVGKIDININAPLLSILCGTTPANLTGKIIPDNAWEQGFMSRVFLIYSNERPLIDVFNSPKKDIPKDLLYDLRLINALYGKFGWEKEYAEYMHKWKTINLEPRPTHPKLQTYNARRFAHVIKLSMVANVDRGGDLNLTKQDFNKAMEWLLEAESAMPMIFKSGPGGADSKAIEEILFYVRQHPQGIEEHKIVNYARLHMEYSGNVIRTIELMEKSDLIYAAAFDAAKLVKLYKARTMH